MRLPWRPDVGYYPHSAPPPHFLTGPSGLHAAVRRARLGPSPGTRSKASTTGIDSALWVSIAEKAALSGRD